MGKKKNNVKEEPMSVGELLFASQLCKRFGFSRENIDNGKGMFTALRVKASKFIPKDIALIQKGFKQRYNKTLLFKETDNNGMISVGYFTKAMT